MSEDLKHLYEARLGRYQAAIALEPTDRVPIASGSTYFAEVYSGNTMQQNIYDPAKWLEAEEKFALAFPEVDALRDNRIYAPLFDVIGLKTYKLPGRDLAPNAQFQFVEKEYMKPEDYDLLIEDPGKFMFECYLSRVLGILDDRGSMRSYIGFLKAGMAQANMAAVMRNRTVQLQEKCGMPQPMAGVFLAPFDALADAWRGFHGIMMDIFRRPGKVRQACDVLVHEMANLALATADPFKRWPIFVPTHKPMFMSPEQFDEFYWPSFKKVIEILVKAGHTVRAYLEGDWRAHIHRMAELPRGKVLCDIDSQGDIYKAKEVLGGRQCITGGIRDSEFILGTPREMRAKVKELCETVGRGGGWIVNGGCNIPYHTKPENFRAMIDAIMEFGWYDKNIKAKPRPLDATRTPAPELKPQGQTTPWEVIKKEWGGVQGDEELIRKNWDQLENAAYTWMWQWIF